jgi:purine-binding chemotaxis protein CheW
VSTFDWKRARERLERTQGELGDLTPAQEESVLRERARELARPLPAADTREQRDVVLFTVAGERFAVDAECVLEALPAEAPTPVPGTPEHLLGVINHRGRVLGVYDLRRALVPGSAPDPDGAPPAHAVAVRTGDLTFAIAAEAVEETSRRHGDALERSLVTVLDLDALVAKARLRIDDD